MAEHREQRPGARPRRLTMSDIAARTGLSTATVSRAMNGKPWVAEETRARVLATLAEAGYAPSGLAASLRTGRTRLIGLMIGEPRDPTALAAMQGALEAAAPAQYGVVVYMTHHEREHERIYSEVLARGWVDGALLLWPTQADAPLIRRIHEGGMPLVLIEPDAKVPHVPAVYADAYHGGYLSAEYLLELGHRRIGILAEPPSMWSLDLSYLDGVRAAMAAAGVPADVELTLLRGGSYEQGYETALRWLRWPDPPTAICCCADMAAMGAIAAARELGLNVPDDLSVVGYDDTQMALWMKPALTTLRDRRRGEAQAACALLLSLIDGAPPPAQPVLVRTDLAVRQSTALPKR